jgi:hypothetical protein
MKIAKPIPCLALAAVLLFSPRLFAAVAETRTIDVLFLYTPSYLSQFSGEAAIRSLIDTDVAQNNSAYSRSSVTGATRVAGVRLLPGPTDAFDGNSGLAALSTNKTVAQWRDEAGADVVCLMRTPWRNYGTNDYSMEDAYSAVAGTSPLPNQAFCVIARGTNSGYWTTSLSFIRAIACVLGCGYYGDSGGYAYWSQGYLWYNRGLTYNDYYRTIMTSDANTSYSLRAYFSNPSIYESNSSPYYSGTYAGDSNHNNSATLTATIPLVAQFRQPRAPSVVVGGQDSTPASVPAAPSQIEKALNLLNGVSGAVESKVSAVGGGVNYSVSATGDGLSYQWQLKRGGITVGVGTNSAAYTLSGIQKGDEVSCVVTGAFGDNTVSKTIPMPSVAVVESATVGAIVAPRLPNGNVPVKIGDSVTLFADTSGDGQIYWQWYRTNVNGPLFFEIVPTLVVRSSLVGLSVGDKATFIVCVTNRTGVINQKSVVVEIVW